MSEDFLKLCKEAYYTGNPIITDAEYDSLVDVYGEPSVGYEDKDSLPLPVRMYSLDKMYSGEDKVPDRFQQKDIVETFKYDGVAVCLTFWNGNLVMAQTRGDGYRGRDVTNNFCKLFSTCTNLRNEVKGKAVVTGEAVYPKEVENARNMMSGALNRLTEENDLGGHAFIPYDTDLSFDSYKEKLEFLFHNFGMSVGEDWLADIYPTDGKVLRVNSEQRFESLGFTSKFPRGAIAVKERTEGVPTTLLDVVWQTGKSGKVTPVAILEPVMIDGAKVSKATLNNPDYIEALGLSTLGCTVYVERAGGIIPKILKVGEQKI